MPKIDNKTLDKKDFYVSEIKKIIVKKENVLSDNRVWDVFGWKKPECVGDLVKYKWQKMWDKYSSSYGKSEWHERYNNYIGLIYHIDSTNCDLHLANVYANIRICG